MENVQRRARILLIEDEADIADSLLDGLRSQGHEVAWSPDGTRARGLLLELWSLVILDLMLPDIDGEALMTFIASLPHCPPVLVLSARVSVSDRLALFRNGCDDYLTKPFFFDEFLERVGALLRRGPRDRVPELHFGDLTLSPETNTVRTPEQAVLLSPKETALLKLLMQNAGNLVTRKKILESVWGMGHEPAANYVGTYFFRLRKKLEKIHREKWLKTVKFSGYSFRPPRPELKRPQRMPPGPFR